MASNTVGYIQCSERHCNEIAEVRQAGGKRQSLYTYCPACGTNQGNGEARQNYLTEHKKDTREELEALKVSETEENAAKPSENAVSSVLDDAEDKPKGDTENKPKGDTEIPPPTDTEDKPKGQEVKLKAPPLALGVLALVAAMITAIFATRKPKQTKTAGQTA